MSWDYCKSDSCCGNKFNDYCQNLLSRDNSGFFILVILSLFFSGGFAINSFLGPYNNIYRCSGFNNGWCNDFDLNNDTPSFFNGNNLGGNNFLQNNFSGFLNGQF